MALCDGPDGQSQLDMLADRRDVAVSGQPGHGASERAGRSDIYLHALTGGAMSGEPCRRHDIRHCRTGRPAAATNRLSSPLYSNGLPR
jgi:hypothetical protein